MSSNNSDPVDPEPAPPARTTRSGLGVRVPKMYDDYNAHGYATILRPPLPKAPPPTSPCPEPCEHSSTEVDGPDADMAVRTERNQYGLFRVFQRPPTADPSGKEGIESLCDAPTFDITSRPTDPQAHFHGPPVPPPLD